MYPPAHVCHALYTKYPELRLAYHGQWGKFCIVRLSPKRMTKLRGSAFEMFDAMWNTAADGKGGKVRDYKGPVFNKHGRANPDWDMLNTDIVMMDICSNTYDVYSGAIVKQIQYQSLNDQKRQQAKVEHEKGKMLRDATLGHAEETQDKLKFYLNQHQGVGTGHIARKHNKDVETAADTYDTSLPWLEYYHVNKRGLKGYLDE